MGSSFMLEFFQGGRFALYSQLHRVMTILLPDDCGQDEKICQSKQIFIERFPE
jgi:hypothetical protein